MGGLWEKPQLNQVNSLKKNPTYCIWIKILEPLSFHYRNRSLFNRWYKNLISEHPPHIPKNFRAGMEQSSSLPSLPSSKFMECSPEWTRHIPQSPVIVVRTPQSGPCRWPQILKPPYSQHAFLQMSSRLVAFLVIQSVPFHKKQKLAVNNNFQTPSFSSFQDIPTLYN